MPVYRIRNWSKHFENNKSRERERCSYVCMPNKQDGLGLTRILALPDGSAIFGVWCLILQACSRQAERDGWMTDDGTASGRPWDLDDLALRWRRPVAEIERCLAVACSPKIGWMEHLDEKCPPSARRVPVRCLEEKGREEKGREGDGDDAGTDLTKPTSEATITADQHLRRLRAIGLWLKDDEERAVAIEAIGMYGGPAMVARAEAIKHGRPGGRIFLSELTVGAAAAPPAPATAALTGEAQRAAIADKLVARVGWEACAAAADIPPDRLGDAATMVEAMRDPGIFARVVERLDP